MLKEFKAFINKGNVVDLAIAVIIGAAFGRIVTSLTDELLDRLLAGDRGDVASALAHQLPLRVITERVIGFREE